jgi:phosphoribosyl 1,2-cyclic phosphate phosphodiesterase
MDLVICGSGAAEAFPALFCTCGCCMEARKRGGKNIRSRSAYALGDEIRIDWGPDSNLHAQKHNLLYEKLRYLLITHSHWDHWVPEELYWRKDGFSVVPDDAILNIYGNAKVRKRLEEALDGRLSTYRLRFHELTPFKAFVIPAQPNITVIPIVAAHDRSETCLNYLIQFNDKTLLQGNDTGWYDEPTWEFLEGYKLDVVILDSTSGKQDSKTGHLSCNWVVEVCERLEAQGSLSEKPLLIATHFSHNGGLLHEDLEAYFAPHGIEVAYDGLRISL